MVRVLQIVDCMDLGGIQTFIMNTYRGIVNLGIQYDFMTFHQRKQYFEDEIVDLGGKIYKLPARREGWYKSRKAISDFFEEHPEYQVVHYQTSSLSYLDPLDIAAKKGIPIRIVHSHSTNAPGNKLHLYLHRFNKKRIKRVATHYFACGELAEKWMFDGTGCEVKIINNGIDVAQYSYSMSTRESIRSQLGLKDKFVVGHVGRFSAVKNHRFLIEIFSKYVEESGDARLMLAGDGELREEMEQYAKSLGIYDKVMFLGARRDVPQLLQAMDYLVMPSLYEGFPVTAIEAQAAGLPCILSNTITKEAVLKENVKMMSINDPPVNWAKALNRDAKRITDNTRLYEAGYDMKETVVDLCSIYTNGRKQ